jgi:hypothetical protein
MKSVFLSFFLVWVCEETKDTNSARVEVVEETRVQQGRIQPVQSKTKIIFFDCLFIFILFLAQPILGHNAYLCVTTS